MSPPSGEEHTALFVLSLPPYASIYLGPEGRIGGTARQTISGFWSAVGAEPGPEPDHLTALLGLYATLLDRVEASQGAHRVLVGEAVRVLFWEHLASWLPAYLVAVRRHRAGFGEWAGLVEEFLVGEANRLGPPLRQAVHRTGLPGGPDPGSEDDLLDALLAPARSGVVLTRADLADISSRLGLGMRMGERRFTLEELLVQDRDRVLGALGELSRSFAEALRALDPVLAPALEPWQRRAAATVSTLRPL